MEVFTPARYKTAKTVILMLSHRVKIECKDVNVNSSVEEEYTKHPPPPQVTVLNRPDLESNLLRTEITRPDRIQLFPVCPVNKHEHAAVNYWMSLVTDVS